MAKARQEGLLASLRPAKALDWRRRMSDNTAYALLVYTALQIWLTMGAMSGTGASLLPYLALAILVGGIIPACYRLERRWSRLSDAQAADPAMAPLFRRDRRMVWVLAFGLPFILTGLLKALFQLFS